MHLGHHCARAGADCSVARPQPAVRIALVHVLADPSVKNRESVVDQAGHLPLGE
jgi:hypothetical protein